MTTFLIYLRSYGYMKTSPVVNGERKYCLQSQRDESIETEYQAIAVSDQLIRKAKPIKHIDTKYLFSIDTIARHLLRNCDHHLV